jgi:hypothetical protein
VYNHDSQKNEKVKKSVRELLFLKGIWNNWNPWFFGFGRTRTTGSLISGEFKEPKPVGLSKFKETTQSSIPPSTLGPEWTSSHQCTSWPFCSLDGLRFFIRRQMGFITVFFCCWSLYYLLFIIYFALWPFFLRTWPHT